MYPGDETQSLTSGSSGSMAGRWARKMKYDKWKTMGKEMSTTWKQREKHHLHLSRRDVEEGFREDMPVRSPPYNKAPSCCLWASQVALTVKNPAANAGDAGNSGSIPGSGRSRRRAWQPTPEFLPGESPCTQETDGLQSIEFHRVRHV